MKLRNQEGRESQVRENPQKIEKNRITDLVAQENPNTDPNIEKEETAQKKRETETDLTKTNPTVEQERQKVEASHLAGVNPEAQEGLEVHRLSLQKNQKVKNKDKEVQINIQRKRKKMLAKT